LCGGWVIEKKNQHKNYEHMGDASFLEKMFDWNNTLEIIQASLLVLDME
jgi:hypothetical protein